jgi:hypothetical protein
VAVSGVVLPLRGLFEGHLLVAGIRRWCGVATTTTTMGLRSVATGPRWWMCTWEGCYWNHGDVDGTPGKVNELVSILKMGRRKTTVIASGACINRIMRLLDHYVLQAGRSVAW